MEDGYKTREKRKRINIANLLQPTFCKKCHTKYEYKSLGVYECPNCGFVEMDEYGVIRTYLDEHGPTPAVNISQETGVSVKIINEYLRQGRLEIPDGSQVYIRCEKCGTDIRYGRFCPACAASLSKELSAAFSADVGEVPKKKKEGKMRFLDQEESQTRKKRH